MPRLKNSLTRKKPEPKSLAGQTGYCRRCAKTKALSNFYEATNLLLDSNGHMSICKDCCHEVYEHYTDVYKNLEEALEKTCQDLDVRFSRQAVMHTKTHIEKAKANNKSFEKVFGYYKSKLMSTGKVNEYIDSFRYKDSDYSVFEKIDSIEHQKVKYDSGERKNEVIDVDDVDFEVTKEMLAYWGKGKEKWEYNILENELFNLKTDFECSDYGMSMIMKDIAFINLEIENIRLGISKSDLSKMIELRSKLMNDANLKPVQSTGADRNEKVSFGTLIKKWENERPIKKHIDDEMKKYIDTYFIGHLAKMEGLRNSTVSKYEEAMKEYTVDINETEGDNYEEEI